MNEKSFFRQIRNFYEKPKSNLYRKTWFYLTEDQQHKKEISLVSLGTNLIRDAISPSIRINLC